ncbi:MAG: LSU ribosomal protein L17p [Ignavibacteriae bacterium]|nr:MAG: LSU ribosomal protein L17p [Ignavibacteriota bacterium]
MRHRKSGRKLKRTASHRKALLNTLATELLRHKKIQTTLAKAKETRPFVEKLITRAKNALTKENENGQKDVHARRLISRYIKDREVVQELFTEIAPKVAQRPGGYTRIIKLGQRLGDAAPLAILELVDFNVVKEKAKSETKTKKEKKGWQKKEKVSEKSEAEIKE